MSGVVLSSQFLTRLLTSGKEDFEHVSNVHAKGGHYEYSSWTDNVDFVHICYIQCDLLDCCILNYEIIPAALANTFSIILQSSALADLGSSCRFYGIFGHI